MNQRLKGDDGQVTAMWVVLATSLLILGTVVYGGSEILGARREVSNLALQAARAGAQEIDEFATAGTNVAVLDKDRAERAVDDYLRPYRADGIQGHGVAEGDHVTVTLWWDKPVPVLGLVGIHTKRVDGRETAEAVRG
jgi:hypothetical protein